MKFSENLRELMIKGGAKEILSRSWIMRLYSGLSTNNLLGISPVFKLPVSKLHFQILKNGTTDHAIMTCVAASMVEQLRRITRQLKEMEKAGQSTDDMVALATTWDLDSPEEIPKDFITFTCGNCGEDFNWSSLSLQVGDTLTIDRLEIK